MKNKLSLFLFLMMGLLAHGQFETLYKYSQYGRWPSLETCREWDWVVEKNKITAIKGDSGFENDKTLINIQLVVKKKSQWFKFTKHKTIKGIEIGEVRIDDDISRFTNMETLGIYFYDSLTFIKSTKNLHSITTPLKYLHLSIPPMRLPNWINSCKHLECITLHLDSSDASFNMLESLAKMDLPNLKYLELEIEGYLDSFPSQLCTLPSLRGITYSNMLHGVDRPLPKNFKDVAKNLTFLCISKLHREDLEQISNLMSLEYLRFESTSFNTYLDCVLLIECLSKLPVLKYLETVNCLYTSCNGYDGFAYEVLETLFPKLTIISNYHNLGFFRSIEFKNSYCDPNIQIPEKHWIKE